jgi:hypothetical protein
MLRSPCHRVELHHLPTASVAEWEHTDESLARHIARAEDIATEASGADERYRAGLPGQPEVDAVFPPKPGPLCSWCDFRRHCPEGQAAGDARLPWDGLTE